MVAIYGIEIIESFTQPYSIINDALLHGYKVNHQIMIGVTFF